MEEAHKTPEPSGRRLADTGPSSHSSQLELAMGTSFGPGGRYEVRKLLGRGGTSVVHEVHDRVLDRRLAGKFVACGRDQASKTAAALEARATSRLNHPYIVTVHDVGIHEDLPYLLMELLDGHSLAHELSRQRLVPRRALAIVLDIASAVQHAHERGVFHFDLKPGNVQLTRNHGAKLMDFGVGSQRLSAPAMGECTDEMVGTPQYMAPEQWSLQSPDARTDVWALGVLLYECVTGLLPFDSSQPGIACARGKPLSDTAAGHVGLDADIERLIHRATRANARERFQTAASFAAALGVVSRILLDEAVISLSSLELRVAAVADLRAREFTDRDIDVLPGIPYTSLVLGLRRLVRRGTLSAHAGRTKPSYRNLDPTLTRACFERLPARERGWLLATRLTHAAAAEPSRDPVARPCSA